MARSTLTTDPADPRNWGDLAAHLLAVEKSMSWEQTHSSFSSWLADVAKQLKRGEATLWRALAAGRYYKELQDALVAEGVKVPALGSADIAASPESLELADKIARVAPAELVRRITLEVMRGTISRRELRSYWETYRPVLDGLTARGRNVPTPRFNPRSIEMVSSRLEADCVAGLLKDGGAWLGTPNAPVYKVVHMKEAGPEAGIVPDVIVLYRPSRSSALELHGIEVVLRPDGNAFLRHYKHHGAGLDQVWLVMPTDPARAAPRLPKEIGLLEADSNGVRVSRRAYGARPDHEALARTLRCLLAREVGA